MRDIREGGPARHLAKGPFRHAADGHGRAARPPSYQKKIGFEKIRENFLFACASDRFVKRYAIRLTG